ncbi:hypothetical protein [Chromobacterium haemolyticum]|uniref:hypothetical protein n=1 Tax=Chromobacterium haemolyticum TaxID=394935 RepID=UPI0013163B51|nr:hypothetical protein [Chromobacterium haemolyticum]BBH14997.1 hypothetical protein CH06BL_42450 [Chromobacterium haemolyticum]
MLLPLGFPSVRPHASPSHAPAPETPAAQTGSLNGKPVRIDDSAESRGKAHAVLSECLSDVRRFFQPLTGRVSRFFGAIPDWVRKLTGQAKPADAATAVTSPIASPIFAGQFQQLCAEFTQRLARHEDMSGAFRKSDSLTEQNSLKQAMMNGKADIPSLTNVQMAALIKDIVKNQLPLPSGTALETHVKQSDDPCALHREMLKQLDGPAKDCAEAAMTVLAQAYREARENPQPEFYAPALLTCLTLHTDDYRYDSNLDPLENSMLGTQRSETQSNIRKAILQSWLNTPAAPADSSAEHPSSPADKPVTAEPWRAQYATVMKQLLTQRPQRSE